MPPHVIRPNLGLRLLYVPRVTTIEFDDVPSGTTVDSVYVSLGVTFASITTSPAQQWSAFAAKAFGAAARTPPNVVSVFPNDAILSASDGGVQVTFANPQFGVAIWAQPFRLPEPLSDEDNRPFLEAFDAHGAFLGEYKFPFSYSDPSFSTWQRMAIQSSGDPNDHAAKIKSVVFSCGAVGANIIKAQFDSLEFWVFEPLGNRPPILGL